MWVAFALQKLLTFFQQNFQHICVSLDVNFNESLTKTSLALNIWAQDFILPNNVLLISLQKHILWVLIRRASAMRNNKNNMDSPII